MNKLPSLRNLQYLIKLHEINNFNRAAEACFVSQSTLSNGIQNLEEQFNGQLIERDHKAFVFTDLGLAVVDQAKKILQQTHELTDMTVNFNQPMVGKIKIGCIPTIAPYILKQFYSTALAKYPELNILFIEETTEKLLKKLEAAELDCVILALPTEIKACHSKILGRDKFWLAVHAEFEVQEAFSYQQLPDESVFLLPQEHCLTDHAISACKLVDKTKISPLSAASLNTLIEMVDCFKGATFLPQLAVKSGLINNRDIKLIEPISGKDTSRDIALVWRQTTQKSATFQQLADLISMVLTDLNCDKVGV
ncbi:hydrogen peroxide-inducible genes activator [Catenovulum maritimum]|uniref:LysR family transcriptional regulator n=1 Tax=Catenovulum maritimum TaxID=1513271 RepID=A0A0J8GXA5_9ALTE|nr:hydrogen peroxide-inducible genes activator [Catenovulum maritimum]KMT65358.1 LysR family transcriptional regulator [Catenovulum maritimum]